MSPHKFCPNALKMFLMRCLGFGELSLQSSAWLLLHGAAMEAGLALHRAQEARKSGLNLVHMNNFAKSDLKRGQKL